MPFAHARLALGGFLFGETQTCDRKLQRRRPLFHVWQNAGGPCAVFAAKMVVGFAEVQVKGVCYGQRINHSDYLSRVLRDACNRQLPALILRPEIGRQQTGDSDEMKWLLGDFTDDAVIRRSAESPHSVTR